MQALQARQRQLAAQLAAADKVQRSAAGQEQRAASLLAELADARAAADAAQHEAASARSRSSVLERAHAAAAEVRPCGTGAAPRAWPFAAQSVHSLPADP